MLQRFRAFLELEFRTITSTKESEEYKAELLGILMDRAEELKLTGVTDENEIYKQCLANLGDFQANLELFRNPPDIKQIARVSLKVITWIVAYILAIAAVFLIVSFTAMPWATSWLILIAGFLGGIVIVSALGAVLLARKKKFLRMRLCISVVITLSIVVTFLFYSVLMSAWSITWLLFLFLPILLVGADLIACIATDSRATFALILAFIAVASSMVYVILGITKFIPWHPYWLIPAIAGVIDIIILLVGSRLKLAKPSKEKSE